jgi:hypothetical protein
MQSIEQSLIGAKGGQLNTLAPYRGPLKQARKLAEDVTRI